MMLFSVIIPIYNAEKTLPRCLDRLLQQSKDCAEVILVNDGSTDSTDLICRRYCHEYPNIRYIIQANSGVSAARNHGLSVATGEFVTFVDSDDFVHDDYFDVLSLYPESDLLYFGAEIVRNDNTTDRIVPSDLISLTEYSEFVSAFIQVRNGSPWNKRFKRELLQRNAITFPADLRIGEDSVFCIRYLMVANSAKAVEQCPYVVDESNQQSISRRYNADISSQALLNYRYSFDAVLQSSFPPVRKNALIQILDCNYYRTAFACVQELFKTDFSFSERFHKTKHVLTAFAENCREIPPKGLTHIMTKFVVRKRLAGISLVIAWAHHLI